MQEKSNISNCLYLLSKDAKTSKAFNDEHNRLLTGKNFNIYRIVKYSLVVIGIALSILVYKAI